MVMRTDNYIKACMRTWLFCESCLHSETEAPNPREDLIRECKECAHSGVAVVSRLISTNAGIDRLAFSCMLHCRKCQEKCEEYGDVEDIQTCAEICGLCAEVVKDLAFPSIILN